MSKLKKSNILIEGYPSYISNLLGNRGITTKEEADFFISANYDDLRDPFTAKGIRESVELTKEAIQNGLKIAIFGDYDADGVLGTSLLYEGLSNCGANIIVRLPCRITEGYGISLKAVKELVNDDVGLIITIDNGIRANEEIKYAIEHGVKVIVLDHHIIGESLPIANVVVDLHREDETFGYSELAGVGVAFLFIRALYKTLQIEDNKCKELLDLVAIGTVADCVPLTDENRILVREGLKVINSDTYNRKGILAIIRRNGITGQVTSTDIGYKIAPVINAPGRLLENGAIRAFNMVVDLDNKGWEEAEFLMRINQERKELTTEGVVLANEYIEDNNMQEDNFYVLYLENQPEGIIGLISGKITEKYKKPSVVFTNDAHGTLKASGRSTQNINLYECLTSCGGLFIKYGGHEQAAGMSIHKKNLEPLKKGLNLFIQDNYSPESLIIEDFHELEVEESEITPEFVEKLDMLEPCGMGNPKPIIKIKNFTLIKKKVQMGTFEKYCPMGAEQLSIKLYGNKIDALCFDLAKEYHEMHEPDVLDLYCTLEKSFKYGIETYNALVSKFEIPLVQSNFGQVDNSLLGEISNLAALL